ncbi:MAG TPA: sigma factor-like helix-turn-helix DNA-binding protein, partial [Plasticicumulans sp.]|nr:sigma factor-like helix-turn-helix DNA-binding protein [Plasticicumulans sp.]
HELAAEYGVSAERIRQIEAGALKKLKTALAA